LERNLNKALELAVACLENAVKAVIEKNEAKIKDLVWKASSELEYALFLLSLKIDEDERLRKVRTKINIDPNFKTNELGPILVSVQELTIEAQKLLNKNVKEVYEKVRAARNFLLRLHEMFEKQRKAKRSKS